MVTEVDGRLAVVDERVELARAGLMEVTESELRDGGGSIRSSWDKSYCSVLED